MINITSEEPVSGRNKIGGNGMRAHAFGGILTTLLLFSPLASPAQAGPHDITIVVPEAIINLDPCNTNHSHVGRELKQNVVETLVELTPDGKINPRLATSWKKLNKNTWEFTLRQNVKFHDGTDFTADAVAQSIERTMNPNLDCINDRVFSTVKITPKVVDDHTLDITTDPPQPILPTLLGILSISSPKTNPTGVERSPIGTGPYEVASWDQSNTLVLKRFDDYWGPKPEVETATYIYRGESAVAAAMVATGEADLAPSIAVQDATNKATDVAYLNGDTARLILTTDHPPLNDVRVRKAINYAIDRSAFVGTIFSDQVKIASQLILPFTNGYNPDLKPWPYDPAQAKKLLAEAKADGVPVDTEIGIYGAAGFLPNQTDMMSALVQMWKAVGLNVEAHTIDKAQLVQLMTKPHVPSRPVGIMVDAHNNDTGDASFTLDFKYYSKGGQSEVNDPELDKLIAQGDVSEGEERTKLYQQAFARLANVDVPDVILFHLVGFARISPRIDYKPNSLTDGELHLSEITFKQ
jgi:peptide/nickel transport system substrate-binding protein